MNSISEFMKAALPWIATGLLLAVFFARAAAQKKGKNRREDHASEGIALGMCFGVALGTALHINTGLGLMVGMLLGLFIGSGIEKKKLDEDEPGAENDEEYHS